MGISQKCKAVKRLFILGLASSITTVGHAQEWLISGTIYTGAQAMDGINAAPQVVEAVVIRDGVFHYTGDLETAKDLVGGEHQRIELGTNIAYPGFIEGHGHLASLGRALNHIDLTVADSYQDVIEQVARAVEKAPPGKLIEGRGWHQSKWSELPTPNINGFPTHHALSQISPHHPVVLGHANGHSALVNAAAMALLSITSATTAPAGGVIVRDADGEPTGILHENAVGLTSALTALTEASAREAILTAQEHAFSWGITGFHDAGAGAVEIAAQRALDQEGLLKLRLYTMVNAQDTQLVSHWLAQAPIIASGNSRFTLASFKVVMDGALGSRTAWLHAPYTDDPSTLGVQTYDAARLTQLMSRAATNGWQVNTHAIGDKANTEVLDAIEAISAPAQDHRYRIEHSQHVQADDIQRFADLGVTASIQSIHLSSDRPWAIDRLGEARIQREAYRWRSFLDAGVALANGTDVPVEPINPIANFYAAVTRKTLAGQPRDGFEATQRLTRAQALASMTLWNAHAGFSEQSTGSITKGKRADMTVLTQDIMAIPEASLLATQVFMTLVDGEIVYERGTHQLPK